MKEYIYYLEEISGRKQYGIIVDKHEDSFYIYWSVIVTKYNHLQNSNAGLFNNTHHYLLKRDHPDTYLVAPQLIMSHDIIIYKTTEEEYNQVSLLPLERI